MRKPQTQELIHARSMLVTAAAAAVLLLWTATPSRAAAQHFRNCTAMNKVYPHGVGQPGAHDKSSDHKPVMNFKVSSSLYAANHGSDRDHDHIACEKL